MKGKTINDLDLRGKRVLLRIDINSEVIGNKVQDNPRFQAHASTIKRLLKKKAVVVILAHQGRPGKKDFTNLKQHAKILNKYVKVKYVEDVAGKKALREIEKLKGEEALLLDNVRKLKGEFFPGKNLFVKKLSKRFDYYVNDAFSVCHRKNSSVVDFPKYLKSAIGPNVEKELNNLDKLKSSLKQSVFILGGNKPEDVVMLISKNKVLTTGILSLIALQTKGYKLGLEDSKLRSYNNIKRIIRENSRGTLIPKDVAISINGKRKEISVKSLPTNKLILDIGSKTLKNYCKEIRNSKAVFFKGATGNIEKKGFDKGTKELLKCISKTSGFSVIAGGSSSAMISKLKINKKSFSHVSLSGGALVYYLSNKKLPGLESIK